MSKPVTFSSLEIGRYYVHNTGFNGALHYYFVNSKTETKTGNKIKITATLRYWSAPYKKWEPANIHGFADETIVRMSNEKFERIDKLPEDVLPVNGVTLEKAAPRLVWRKGCLTCVETMQPGDEPFTSC